MTLLCEVISKDVTELLMPCPVCASGDIRWDSISLRPYCNDCKHWGEINYDSYFSAIYSWNVTSKNNGNKPWPHICKINYYTNSVFVRQALKVLNAERSKYPPINNLFHHNKLCVDNIIKNLKADFLKSIEKDINNV